MFDLCESTLDCAAIARFIFTNFAKLIILSLTSLFSVSRLSILSSRVLIPLSTLSRLQTADSSSRFAPSSV